MNFISICIQIVSHYHGHNRRDTPTVSGLGTCLKFDVIDFMGDILAPRFIQ